MRNSVNITRLLKGLNLLIVLGILLSLLFTVRSILNLKSYSAVKSDITDNTASSVAIRKKGLQDYSVILSNNPFGFDAGQLSEIRQKEEAAVFRTDLTLVGTVSDTAGKGYAVFATDEGRQEIFKSGERVYSMGRLTRVMSDGVKIDGGRIIPLIDIGEAFRKYGIRKKVSQSVRRTPKKAFIRRASAGVFVVDRERLEETIQNPQQLMTDARLQPVFRDGKQNGFVLKEVRRGGLYSKLGLRNRDVLLRINEYNITDPEAALQAFNALRGADRIVLDILRDGKRKTLTYQIK